jgi:hypothetical protein
MRKSAHLQPVGKGFTNPARNFLPAGNAGLQASGFQLPDRTLPPAGAT